MSNDAHRNSCYPPDWKLHSQWGESHTYYNATIVLYTRIIVIQCGFLLI